MARAQYVEGSVDEVTARLYQTYAGQERIRIFVELTEAFNAAGDAEPQPALREKAHGPFYEGSGEMWNSRRAEIRVVSGWLTSTAKQRQVDVRVDEPLARTDAPAAFD
ncbi:MAG: hypothetical protein ACLQVD_14320 [Capsulimonadaceae bacterium]